MDMIVPSKMDGWFIDTSFYFLIALTTALLAIVGWGIRKSIDNLKETIADMNKQIKEFSSQLNTKVDDHEKRLTRIEVYCYANHGGNPTPPRRRWYDPDHPDSPENPQG